MDFKQYFYNRIKEEADIGSTNSTSDIAINAVPLSSDIEKRTTKINCKFCGSKNAVEVGSEEFKCAFCGKLNSILLS